MIRPTPLPHPRRPPLTLAEMIAILDAATPPVAYTVTETGTPTFDIAGHPQEDELGVRLMLDGFGEDGYGWDWDLAPGREGDLIARSRAVRLAAGMRQSIEEPGQVAELAGLLAGGDSGSAGRTGVATSGRTPADRRSDPERPSPASR